MIAWSRLENRPVFGSTDMHGFGNAATVWNVVRVPGWRSLGDDSLEHAILARLRAGGVTANQVLALRRWLPETRLGSAFSVPINLALLLRTASRPHALALLAWIWVAALGALLGGEGAGLPEQGLRQHQLAEVVEEESAEHVRIGRQVRRRAARGRDVRSR